MFASDTTIDAYVPAAVVGGAEAFFEPPQPIAVHQKRLKLLPLARTRRNISTV